MGKYIASIALLCAVLVAAPVKADVVNAVTYFGFDPEQYDVVALLTYTFDGEDATLSIANPAMWNVQKADVNMGTEEDEFIFPGLSVQLLDPAFAASYSGFFFGYNPDWAFESLTWLNAGALMEGMSWVPLAMALGIGVGNGLDIRTFYEDEDGYLYSPDLGGAIGSGGVAELAFMTEFADNVPFTFSLYGIVAKDAGGEANLPEPATLALMGLGLAGLGIARRRMKK